MPHHSLTKFATSLSLSSQATSTVTADTGYQVIDEQSNPSMHHGARVIESDDSVEDTVDGREEEDDASGTSRGGDENCAAGCILLADIMHVDSTFLSSEELLVAAMVEMVTESAQTLLSYHCHSQLPSSISCVGVLPEGHIFLHSWPAHGVITVDLFAFNSNPLLPIVDHIKNLFAVPQAGAGICQASTRNGEQNDLSPESCKEQYVNPPRFLWSHVLRGFRPPLLEQEYPLLDNDVTDIVLKPLHLDHKAEIASVQTDYQHVGVYDLIDGRFSSVLGYERSIRPELKHTYEGNHPELFRPNRILFLDGVTQSMRNGLEAYHEALVHPGMFAHPNPKRAAIIGGGEGATLREILKHTTVEFVKMVEIDELMVNISRQHLPDWSDCSDLVGSADSCFEDPRTDLLCEDALAWFIDRFKYPECNCDGNLTEAEQAHCKCTSKDGSSGDAEEDPSSDDEDFEYNPHSLGDEGKFDVIVMDALDPQDSVEFAEILYNNEIFLESLYGALTDEGILVMQLGMSPENWNPAEELGFHENRATVMSMVAELGFASMHLYEESHCGFDYSWSFLVACKSNTCRNQWYATEAKITSSIHNRISHTKSGAPALAYFDGATMRGYQVPPKAWETVVCRRDPQPVECSLHRGLDPMRPNVRVEHFELTMSSSDAKLGLGLLAKVDIPEGSLLMQEQMQQKVHLGPLSMFLIHYYYGHVKAARALGGILRHIKKYQFKQKEAADGYYVGSGLLTLIDESSGDTDTMICRQEVEASVHSSHCLDEKNSDTLKGPSFESATNDDTDLTTFNPVYDRHIPTIAAAQSVAARRIRLGEMIH